MKIKLIIAYDGAAYQGWQVQRVGTGVQEILESVLQRLFPGCGRLHGASRTDTGVHALGMVAHCEIPDEVFRMPMRKVRLAMNAHLPEDIRVTHAHKVADTFHARFDATGKQYRYVIWNHPSANPLLRTMAWHVPVPLDVARMREATRCFVGRRDFRSMASQRNYPCEDAVRTLYRCDVLKRGAEICVVLEGDGFLYKMCRAIVGTLVQVGKGKWTPADVTDVLERRDRAEAGMNAPACGLVLKRVYYRPRRAVEIRAVSSEGA